MAGQWFWEGDHAKWTAYGLAVNIKIEAAYAKKENKVTLDTERYLEFSTKLQRRFDDKNKVRAVKREVMPPFNKDVFVLVGFGAQDETDMIDKITKGEGLVTRHMTDYVCAPYE